MGAHSTVHISRSAARQYLIEQAESFDDETLARMIDLVLYDRLYNCTIVNDDDPDTSDSLLRD